MTPFDVRTYPRPLFLHLALQESRVPATLASIPTNSSPLKVLKQLIVMARLRPKVVVCINPSWRLSLPFLVLSKFLGLDFFTDCQDLFYYAFSGAKGLVFRSLEMFVIRYSRGVIFSGRIAERTFGPTHKNPSTAIPLGYLDLVTTRGPLPSLDVQDHSAPRVLYFGSGWAFDDLPVLFAAFKQLIELYPNAELLLVGIDSKNRSGVDKSIREFEIGKNVIVLPSQKNLSDELASILFSAHILVLPAKDTPFARITVRYKLYSYLMVGRPIVATDLPAIRDALKGTSSAILVKASDANEFFQGMLSIIGDADAALQMGRSARFLFKQYYEAPICYHPYVRFLMANKGH